MNKKVFQYMNRMMWIVIVILISYILMKSSVLFSHSDLRQTIGKLGDSVVRQVGSQVIMTNSPLFRYAASTTSNSNQENVFAKYIDQFFAINYYTIETFKDNVTEENIQYSKNLYDRYEIGEEFQLSEEERLEIEKESLETLAIEYQDEIGFIRGETYLEDMSALLGEESVFALKNNQKMMNQLRKEYDYEYFVRNFYIVSAETKATKELFRPKTLLSKDMTLKATEDAPQILIYHTHSQEAFIDSRKGESSDTIVGIGAYLTQILSEEYGYNVIHDTTTYDIMKGSLDRNKAYNYALTGVSKILDKNPSIEVVIDLHRDGVSDNSKLVTNINGKQTARLMFLNGLSRNKQGPIEYLANPNISENLAFSLQLHMKSMEEYPNFTKKIFLRDYRYNQHLRGKSLLVELGNQNNTVSEARNAMEPLAYILSEVLEGK